MILKNAASFIGGEFKRADIKTENGVITDISDSLPDGGSVVDCSDCYVLPGLVDIHTHGCVGYDFSSASPAEIQKMRAYYLENGITSILPTTVTLSDDGIRKAVSNIKEASKDASAGAVILGANLEGPYLSPKKCGAHDISLLKAPDADFICSLGDFVKIVNAAPEYPETADLIRSFGGKVSIAHTDCGYETAVNAINAGADHITHIFNAMNGLHHRNPGVIGAFFDTDATAEIICDSIHISPPVLRMMFGAKAERLAIISDSMSATGLCDGSYKLGSLSVSVKNSVATLPDGTLAGSSMNAYSMMKNLISIGIEPEKAILSATKIPADSIGLGNIGRIERGCRADFVIADKDFTVKKVILEGYVARTA